MSAISLEAIVISVLIATNISTIMIAMHYKDKYEEYEQKYQDLLNKKVTEMRKQFLIGAGSTVGSRLMDAFGVGKSNGGEINVSDGE